MSYQWDMLLLEVGFLTIFLGWHPIVLPLFRWLLFRLMLLSGLAKLMSGDPTWRNLTALRYHYETQPLPTPLAWYANLLPLGCSARRWRLCSPSNCCCLSCFSSRAAGE